MCRPAASQRALKRRERCVGGAPRTHRKRSAVSQERAGYDVRKPAGASSHKKSCGSVEGV
jgi:hypothetical protein